MNKVYITTLKIVAMLLIFVLGMVSSLAVLIVGGVFAADKITLNKLESIGVNIDTSGLFDESADNSIRDMSLIMLIEEINSIGSLGDAATLDYYSEKFGLILPPEGESHWFDAMRILPVSKLFTQDGLDTALSNIFIGDILGYQFTVDNTDPENPVNIWTDPNTNIEISGPEALLVDYSLYSVIYDGIDVSDMVDTAPVGTLLGYTYNDETKEWLDSNGVAVIGPMHFIANKHISEVGGALNNALVGEILGYTRGTAEDGAEWDGVWYQLDADNNKVAMTGAMKAFADNKLSNIEDGIGDASIGTILGYDKIDGVWQKEGAPLTGSMLAFADDTLNTLQEGIDKKQIGIMLGYQYEAESKHWYKLDADNNKVYMSGTMRAFADSTLGNIEESVKTAEIGIILGYDKDEVTGIWTDDGTPVTGIMKSIAGEDLQHLSDSLETKKIGDLLGYTFISSTDPLFTPVNPTAKNPNGDFPDGYWVNSAATDPDAPCSAFVQIMSDATFSTIDTLQDTITIGKLIPASERNEGFLSLLDPNTTIDSLSAEVVRVFNTASIHQLHSAGALNLESGDVAKLQYLDVYDSSIQTCLSTILNAVPAIP